MRPAHDLRLVPAALSGYGAAALVMAHRSILVLGLAVLCVMVGTLLRRVRAAWWLAAAVALVVAATTQVHLDARWEGEFQNAVGRSALFEVTVLSDAERMRSPGWHGEQRYRVIARVEQWDHPEVGWVEASAHVMLMGAQVESLMFGDRARLSGTMLATDGGWEVAVVTNPDLETVEPPDGANAVIAAARQGLRDATAHLPDETRGLVRGMVVGDRTDMPDQQLHHMRVANVTHLTVVSGAHFAIVLVASAGLMRLWQWPRRVRAVVAGVLMVAFALVALPEPSVVRALGMALAICAALWWGRPAQAMPALAATVVVTMVTMPWLSISFGFALSVTAVTALVLWSPVLGIHLQRWMAPALARALAIPIAAAVACAPILVLFTDGVGTLGPVANLVAALCAAPVTLLGLVALVIHPLAPGAAALVATLAGWSAWPIAWVTEVVAQAPGRWLHWPTGTAGAVWMALVSLTVIVATSWRVWPARRRALAAFVTVGAVMAVVHGPVANAGTTTVPDWQVVFCDVGQGDMTLLRAGPHEAVVIDVGSAGAGGVQCAQRHGVREVPLLILTHPHEDHDGAVLELVEAMEVSHVWLSPAGTQSGSDRAWHQLQQWQVDARVVETGETAQAGLVTVQVWHPPRSGHQGMGLNDSSVVVWASTESLTVLAPGDVEIAAQRMLLRQRPGGVVVDVLKAAHHGSHVQYEPWVRSLRATVVVFSAGIDNRHGHPHQDALDMYGAVADHLARTDQCGDLVFTERDGQVVMAPC